MRNLLLVVFATILVTMIAVTIRASLDRSVLDVGPELTSDPWFQATLVDAYLGFLTFYVWVAYKERRNWARIVWFALIMLLGNIAMSLYVLIQLVRLKPGDGPAELLLRRESADHLAAGRQ